MRNQILEDLKTAMKNQDKERLSVIRMVKGSIQMSELNKKHELSDEEVIDVITKEIKSRKDSINEFKKGSKLSCVLVTQNGKKDEKIIGILTAWDILGR